MPGAAAAWHSPVGGTCRQPSPCLLPPTPTPSQLTSSMSSAFCPSAALSTLNPAFDSMVWITIWLTGSSSTDSTCQADDRGEAV